MPEVFGMFVIKEEVEDPDGVDGFQFKVPLSFLGLLPDGKGGVV